MEEIYIVDGLRTPIGSFLGSLKSFSVSKLGSFAIKALLENNKINGSDIDEVIAGNVLSAGAGMGPARQASVGAGVPVEVPAYGINMLCCSGMKSVLIATAQIRAGNAGLIIAGGMESMSNAAFLLPAKARQGYKMGDIAVYDSMTFDGLTDAFNDYHMGITAENIAEKHGITREAQDEFALNSQIKGIKAVDSGEFKDEIVPVEVTEGKNCFTFDTDEYPNRTTNAEKLAKLKPAFKNGGTISAGNSAGINDGAAFVIVASGSALKEFNLSPKAQIIAAAQAGVDPKVMGLGPVFAAGLIAEIGDINRFDNQASLAKFSGLAWTRHQSGSFEAQNAKLIRSGNRYLRYYFIEAANSVRRCNSEYARFYNLKFKEVNKFQHKRALALTARKLVRLVFALLKSNRLYTPSDK
jgi:acetyl-CoA C-acetyltransferase